MSRPAAGPSRASAPAARPRVDEPNGGEKANAALHSANVALHRELQEARDQLAAAVFGPIADEGEGGAAAWAAAQLAQSRRQVALLSEALATRSDMSVELEAVLLQLRQPAADGTRSEAAVWAGNALRRLRSVQWAEDLSRDRVTAMPAAPRSAGTRSAGGQPPAQQRQAQRPQPHSQSSTGVPQAGRRGAVGSTARSIDDSRG